MSSKTAVMIGMVLGSTIGGYLPSFFGISAFSFIGIVGNVVGGIVGIFIAYKLTSS